MSVGLYVYKIADALTAEIDYIGLIIIFRQIDIDQLGIGAGKFFQHRRILAKFLKLLGCQAVIRRPVRPPSALNRIPGYQSRSMIANSIKKPV